MKKWLLVICVLMIAGFLRLYRLPDLFIFSGDEEYQSILAMTLVKHLHIIWIGVNAGHLGFYLGPFWTYFTALFLFLSKGNPLITGYVAAIIGVATTALIIYTGQKLFSFFVGLSAGLLYATLPLMVFFDQKYWNPSLVPFLSVGMFLSLSQVRFYPKWWWVFFGLFGLVFHTHLSLIPFGLIAIFLFLKDQKHPKIYLIGGIIFLIIYSPLIFFDYFHKGSNITTVFRLNEFSSSPSVAIAPIRHFEVLFQTLGRIWYLKDHTSNADNVLFACSPFAYLDNTSLLAQRVSSRTEPNFWVSLISLIILLYFLISSYLKNNFNQRLLAASILSIIIAYLFLPIATHEYYLLGIFPLILFIPGILLNRMGKKLWLPVLTISLLGVITTISAKDDFGFHHKQQLINQVLNIVGSNTFEIDQVGLCQHYGGWRYLFKLAGRTPQKSTTDANLGWLYPDEMTSGLAKYKVVFHESRVDPQTKLKNATTLFEGGFRADLINQNQ